MEALPLCVSLLLASEVNSGTFGHGGVAVLTSSYAKHRPVCFAFCIINLFFILAVCGAVGCGAPSYERKRVIAAAKEDVAAGHFVGLCVIR